jgi:hypothetical protein
MDSTATRSLTGGDIQTFTRSRLFDDGHHLLVENLEDITSTVSVKADGMFLWAELVVPEIISKARWDKCTRRELIESINKLPPKMEKMCLYLLRQILRSDESVGREANKVRKDTVLELLRWAFHSVRPLSLRELRWRSPGRTKTMMTLTTTLPKLTVGLLR